MNRNTLPFLPDNDTLAVAVLNAQKGDDAVVGRYRDEHGAVVIFTDTEAQQAYGRHMVNGLASVGSFKHEVLVRETITAEPTKVTVEVAYGRL